ncbi:unnamed protein product [Mesocestoides corti]|uniref:Uncharacterized protein n=1 Tax=Mesocestoides corti TaxID=53468 RepID=A0A0R3U9G5_MESCO|nr:unnamed protein product [Mesocestoides corti]
MAAHRGEFAQLRDEATASAAAAAAAAQTDVLRLVERGHVVWLRESPLFPGHTTSFLRFQSNCLHRGLSTCLCLLVNLRPVFGVNEMEQRACLMAKTYIRPKFCLRLQLAILQTATLPSALPRESGVRRMRKWAYSIGPPRAVSAGSSTCARTKDALTASKIDESLRGTAVGRCVWRA